MRLVQTFGTRLRTAGADQLLQASPRFAGVGNAIALANFAFEGAGAAVDTIALFGHAFERAMLNPADPVVLRRQDNDDPLRTQMNVLSQWPDGSVKTALLAAELPALADAATLATVLRVGETHPDPGPGLSFATLLSGRTAMVRTWAPGNTTTPLWSFDPLAAIGADRWHEGPLAVSTRVETPMPSSANTEGRQSVRLIADVVATKDGFLELDVCFSNDRLPYTSQDQTGGGFADCGPATFGYTIEIDGQIVYDQRPASGAATTLLQYSQWIRRRGRHTNGTVIGWANHRPYFRPDLALLAKSGVQPNYLTARPVLEGQLWHQISRHMTPEILAARENDPYWNWNLARGAGDVGGRPEIGHRTFQGAVWMATGFRDAEFLSVRTFEAAATRAMYYRDWEAGDWINPVTWPRFTIETQGGTSPPGTPKSLALSSPQTPTHTQLNHITIDRAHHGAFNFPIALLHGRRIAYDSMAARVNWLCMMNRNRHVPGAPAPPTSAPAWRGTVTPNHHTGAAWGPRFGAGQTRDQSWDLRCVVDAAAILPDAWPNRVLYDRHAQAYFNAWAGQIASVHQRFAPELGTPFFDGVNGKAVNYMMAFAIPSLVTAQRCDIGGPNRDVVIAEIARSRCGWITVPTFNHRNYMRGNSFRWVGLGGGPDAKNWADIATLTIADPDLGDTPEDWTFRSGEGDWLRNGNMALINIAYALAVPLDVKAMAAEAAILCTSERIRSETGAANRPTAEPQSYYTSYFQTNAIWPAGLTSERNAAPVILPGQELAFPVDAQNGTVVGVVQITGTLPRNSTFGRAVNDAFELTSQPAGNPLSISWGGVLRVANAAAVPTTPFTIQVRARTDDQRNHNDPPGTEYRSAAVSVGLVPVVLAPTLRKTDATPWTVPANAPVGAVVGTLSYSGSEPITLSEIGGDTDNLFTLDGSGNPRAVRVGAAMSAFVGAAYTLRYRAEGPGGSAELDAPISVTPAIMPPSLADQTLTITEGVPPGTDAAPTLDNTGGPASTLTITAGNAEGRFAAVAPNIIRSAGRLARAERISYALTVAASNAIGSDSAVVTVNVASAAYVYAIPNTVVLAAVSAARRLRQGYEGPLLRAYHPAGEELDIGFDLNGLLDVGTLVEFAGGQACTAALYDQSPMEQGLMLPHAGGLPFITDGSGQVVRVGPGNRPTLRFHDARGLRWDTFRTAGTAEFGVLMAARRDFATNASRALLTLAVNAGTSPSSTNTSHFFRSNPSNTGLQTLRDGTTTIASSGNNTFVNGAFNILGSYTLNQTNRRRAISIGATFYNAADTAAWTAMNAQAFVALGGRANIAGEDWIGEISEAVLFGAIDLAADQPAIRSNMATFYGV
jgi:hypothetical protein